MLCLIYSITAINPIERILRKSGPETRGVGSNNNDLVVKYQS